MKPIHALAILGALAAGPALAQEYPAGPVGQPLQTGTVQQSSDQAVQPQFLAQIQQQLQSQGLYDGPIDGVYGQQTQAALAEWQRQQGIQPSGQLDAQTLAALNVGDMATQQAEMPRQEQLQSPDPSRSETQVQPPAEQDQQASQPEEQSSDVETLREEHMSAPNVEGEATPERPGTGVPAPGRTPGSLEQPQNR